LTALPEPERHAPTNCERSMKYTEYLREEAEKYRRLAAKAKDAKVKQELLELAAVCEEAANRVEDHQAGG
jgi:hypothetical protein